MYHILHNNFFEVNNKSHFCCVVDQYALYVHDIIKQARSTIYIKKYNFVYIVFLFIVQDIISGMHTLLCVLITVI